MAPSLYPDRSRRERSVSAYSDPNFETVTERKLNVYARFYGFPERSLSCGPSDYVEALCSNKRLARISEDREFPSGFAAESGRDVYDGPKLDGEYFNKQRAASESRDIYEDRSVHASEIADRYNRRATSETRDYSNQRTSVARSDMADYYNRRSENRESFASRTSESRDYSSSSALVAANEVDAQFQRETPARDLYTPAVSSYSGSSRYGSSLQSADTGLHDLLSYTKSVLSQIGTSRGIGNVRVHLNYRPVPPVYNYSPVHRHYHVYAPKNYYSTPALTQPSYQLPPQEYHHHHHHHHPARRTTEVTRRTYYVPLSAVPGGFSRGAGATTSYTTSGESSYETAGESSSSSQMRASSASSQMRASSASQMRDSASQMRETLAIDM